MLDKSEPDGSAGELLYTTLISNGYEPWTERHAGAAWITIAAGTGQIRISNADANIDHRFLHHGGWTAEHIHDLAGGDSTIVYAVGIRNFAQDTEGVTHAIDRYLRDPRPWQEDPDYAAVCCPYVTAGERLRRALVDAGIDAHHLLTLGGEPDPVTIRPAPERRRPRIEITGRDGRLDHHPDDHRGWAVQLVPIPFGPVRRLEVASSAPGDFAQDTAATVAAVSAYLREREPRPS
jgi:hypothetical protein